MKTRYNLIPSIPLNELFY